MTDQHFAFPSANGSPSDALLLRPFTDADVPDVVQLHATPEVRALLVEDYPLHQPEVALLFVRRLRELMLAHPGLGIWHASRGGRFAGWFNLMPLNGQPQQPELGSLLLPWAWGTGLALQGGEGLLNHAFDTLALSAVWGTCHPRNHSARMCLMAMGFEARGMWPYDQGEALYHELSGSQWPAWRQRPRAQRLREAARCLRPSGRTRTTGPQAQDLDGDGPHAADAASLSRPPRASALATPC